MSDVSSPLTREQRVTRMRESASEAIKHVSEDATCPDGSSFLGDVLAVIDSLDALRDRLAECERERDRMTREAMALSGAIIEWYEAMLMLPDLPIILQMDGWAEFRLAHNRLLGFAGKASAIRAANEKHEKPTWCTCNATHECEGHRA